MTYKKYNKCTSRAWGWKLPCNERNVKKFRSRYARIQKVSENKLAKKLAKKKLAKKKFARATTCSPPNRGEQGFSGPRPSKLGKDIVFRPLHFSTPAGGSEKKKQKQKRPSWKTFPSWEKKVRSEKKTSELKNFSELRKKKSARKKQTSERKKKKKCPSSKNVRAEK